MMEHELIPCARVTGPDGSGDFWVRCTCGWKSNAEGKWGLTHRAHWQEARVHWSEATGAKASRPLFRRKKKPPPVPEQGRLFDE